MGHKNRADEKKELDLVEAIALVKDTFVTAGERDIYTGDAIEIFTITSDGTSRELFDLKKD